MEFFVLLFLISFMSSHVHESSNTWFYTLNSHHFSTAGGSRDHPNRWYEVKVFCCDMIKLSTETRVPARKHAGHHWLGETKNYGEEKGKKEMKNWEKKRENSVNTSWKEANKISLRNVLTMTYGWMVTVMLNAVWWLSDVCCSCRPGAFRWRQPS